MPIEPPIAPGDEDENDDLNGQNDDTGAEKQPKEPTTNKYKIVRNYVRERFRFRYNSLKQEIEFAPVNLFEDGTEWQVFDMDRESVVIWGQLQDHGLTISQDFIIRAIESISEPFNPFERYFDDLRKRTDLKNGAIAQLAETVKVGHDEEHWPRLLRRWLCAAVACALGRRHNDVMLLFVSPKQGLGKTRWMNKLCPKSLGNYIHTGHVNIEKDEAFEYLSELFLLNIDDQLASIFGRDFEKIKGFISADSTTTRKKYARRAKKRKRVASIVGSVNRTNLFPDDENRRYLAFETLEIKHAHEVDMDAVWREALMAVENGEASGFGAEDFKLINEINVRFAETNTETELVMSYFEPCEEDDPNAVFMNASEIMILLNDKSKLKLNENKIGRALRRLGFQRKSRRRKGSKYPQYGYYVINRAELNLPTETNAMPNEDTENDSNVPF